MASRKIRVFKILLAMVCSILNAQCKFSASKTLRFLEHIAVTAHLENQLKPIQKTRPTIANEICVHTSFELPMPLGPHSTYLLVVCSTMSSQSRPCAAWSGAGTPAECRYCTRTYSAHCRRRPIHKSLMALHCACPRGWILHVRLACVGLRQYSRA